MKAKIPHVIERDGRRYWQPSTRLRKAGFAAERISSDDAGDRRAAELNAQVAAWRAGGTAGNGEARSLTAIAGDYLASPGFARLKASTRGDYRSCLQVLTVEKGEAPIQAITRRDMQQFYDRHYRRAPARANQIMRVARILFAYAMNRDLVAANPAAGPRLVQTAPRIRVWTADELEACTAVADDMGSPSIADAVLLGYYTGQRQGDVLGITRLQCGAERLRLRQQKRRAWVAVPWHPALGSRLSASLARLERDFPDCPALVTCEATGKPWAASSFRHRFVEIRAAAARRCPSIATARFLDLRDTCVTRLARAGCSVPQICAITGHSERAAYDLLKHYLAIDEELAAGAVDRLLAWEATA